MGGCCHYHLCCNFSVCVLGTLHNGTVGGKVVRRFWIKGESLRTRRFAERGRVFARLSLSVSMSTCRAQSDSLQENHMFIAMAKKMEKGGAG